MTTTAEIQPGIPVREGVYGDRVVAVEPGGVEFIPLGDRHGRPLDLFWTWMSPNLEFATVFVGVISVLFFRQTFWQAAAGIVVGTALGSLSHGFLSTRGPAAGVPQMVLSRIAFGYRGNGVAVWNDALNAADCPAVDAWRQSLQDGSPTTKPAPQDDCTDPTFGNSDIYAFTSI